MRLANLPGITDHVLLDKDEANLVSIRSQEIWLVPLEGKCDFFYRRSVHRHLFQDVYAWAGELRTVDISKGSNPFAHHAFVESAALPFFHQLAVE